MKLNSVIKLSVIKTVTKLKHIMQIFKMPDWSVEITFFLSIKSDIEFTFVIKNGESYGIHESGIFKDFSLTESWNSKVSML